MLGDFLNSINWDKKDLMMGGGEVTERSYPRFPVLRSLSYHQDVILYVQELNKIGTAAHNVSNKQHYEFLLHSLPKGRRFAKWGKPDSTETVELIMQAYDCSRDKAIEYSAILTPDQVESIRKEYAQGGTKSK